MLTFKKEKELEDIEFQLELYSLKTHWLEYEKSDYAKAKHRKKIILKELGEY